MNRILRFGIVGAIGFAVDAGVLLILVQVGATPLLGRLASFFIAATVTFFLNHRFTFRATGSPSMSKWTSYLAFTAFGAVLNIGIYQLWITHQGASRLQLAVGAAIGSVVAMFVNYSLSRHLVFKPVARASG